MTTTTLHPLMKLALNAARNAEKAGASTWDALATYASTEERATLVADGLKRAVDAQIEAAAPLFEADWNPNSNSTFRIYRRLIVMAREHSVPVCIADDDGNMLARSVGEVRKDVKAAQEAAKEADGEGKGGEEEGKGEASVLFDSLPADERIAAAIGFIRKAYGELPTLEAKAAARKLLAGFMTEIGG
jgi:hypothetical protein